MLAKISSLSGSLKLTSDKSERILIFFLILAIGLGLRLFALETIPALSGDEAWIATQAKLQAMGLPHTWITPSGRLFSPLYMAISLALRTHDAFWIRFPAFFIGILTVSSCYFLLGKVIGRKAVLITTSILAVFPFHVMYSRLGLEICLTPFFSVLLTYFVLNNNWWKGLLVLIAGTISHPSFILLTPVIFVPWFFRLKEQKKLPGLPVIIGICIALAAVGVWAITWIPKYYPFQLPSFALLGHFILSLLGLISGNYLESAFVQPTDFMKIIVSSFITLIVIVVLSLMYFRKLLPQQKYYYMGILLGLFAFYFVGAEAIKFPGNERMILFLCFPICLYLGLLLSHFTYGIIAGYAISFAMIFILLTGIFVPFIEHGGVSWKHYHAGPVDPKRAAITWITKKYPFQPYLLAEDFQIYWNVLNIALSRWGGEIVIAHTGEGPGLDIHQKLHTEKQIIKFMKQGGIAICYVGGKLEETILNEEEKGMSFEKQGFKDFADKDFVMVYKAK